MNAKFLRIILLMAVAVVAPSCRTYPSFQHYSVLFEVPLNGGAKQVYETQILISLTAMDYKEKKCFFQITHTGLGESAEEWVAVGAYFQSASWLGSRGFRLDEMRGDRALVRRFSFRLIKVKTLGKV